MKPKFEEKAKLWYIDTDCFIVYIKTDDVYKDIAKYIEAKFDSSHYELNIPLPKRNNKKGIGLINDELGRKVMKYFVGLRAKTYKYLIDDNSEDKKQQHRHKNVCCK